MTSPVCRAKAPALLALLIGCVAWLQGVQATDLYRLVGDPAARGSADIVGLSDSPLTALSANPALLSDMPDSAALALHGFWVDSTFISKLDETAEADQGPGILPEFAIKRDLPGGGWSWGAGLTVSSAMEADFQFVDPPGTAAISYGLQTHRSSFVVVRGAAALSYRINDTLAAGLSIGLLYNRNQLEAPYIFQNYNALIGLKVLVDLDVDDMAANASTGVTWELSDELQLQLAYTMETEFEARGNLSGDLSALNNALGLGFQDNISYQAQVRTALPSVITAGLTWSASERVRLGVQFDRIGWKRSFKDLPISLTQGSNADLNGFLGSDEISDVAPLNWQDEDTVHVGLEYLLNDDTTLRAGVETTDAPVPSSTLTPMTGSILDSAFSVGASFLLLGRSLDVYYRYTQSDDVRVEASALQRGEYDNTELSVNLHSLGIALNF